MYPVTNEGIESDPAESYKLKQREDHLLVEKVISSKINNS